MNSPKNINMALLDLGLKHSLKNWSSRNRPPMDGKKRLLLKVAQISKKERTRKASSLIFWLFGVNHSDFYSKIYHERLKLKELLYSQCAVRLS
jgi:hypothetical protein